MGCLCCTVLYFRVAAASALTCLWEKYSLLPCAPHLSGVVLCQGVRLCFFVSCGICLVVPRCVVFLAPRLSPVSLSLVPCGFSRDPVDSAVHLGDRLEDWEWQAAYPVEGKEPPPEGGVSRRR